MNKRVNRIANSRYTHWSVKKKKYEFKIIQYLEKEHFPLHAKGKMLEEMAAVIYFFLCLMYLRDFDRNP